MDISGVHTVIPVLVTGIEPAQVLGLKRVFPSHRRVLTGFPLQAQERGRPSQAFQNKTARRVQGG